jgi:hypothetical protein
VLCSFSIVLQVVYCLDRRGYWFYNNTRENKILPCFSNFRNIATSKQKRKEKQHDRNRNKQFFDNEIPKFLTKLNTLGRMDDTLESHALAVWFYQVHPVRIPI